MKRYNIVNNALGWVAFLVAAITYLLTIEPTASFWDCPEFIVQGTMLEVGHPPGNPIFMLTARFFITLLGGMVTPAMAVNIMSALLSAGTILLLFWTVTHFARKLVVKDGEVPGSFQTAIIMAAGMCGALAYTWSDTFWFSAVEGEVYAFSSFCTALVVWLMLKWENRADEPGSDRYLVLIAYVIGVSIAVHLLNLLCIPALGLIYYYRKTREVNVTGSFIALGVSCVLVAAILYGLVPGFIQMAQGFELLFVNGFGMSYNMGALIYAVFIVALVIVSLVAIYRSQERKETMPLILTLATVFFSGMLFIGHSVAIGLVLLVTLTVVSFLYKNKITRRFMAMVVLSIGVIFVGYSSYALLLIRASASTPMNQNAPDNVFALSSYLNREQYGDRPLFNGPVFAERLKEFEYPRRSGQFFIEVDDYGRPRTEIVDSYLRSETGAPFNNEERNYTKIVKTDPSQPDRYVDSVTRPNYKTISDLNMFLPRIYSSAPEHVPGYKSWSGYRIKDFDNIPRDVRDRWAAQGYVPRMEAMRYFPGMEVIVTYVNASDGTPYSEELVWKPKFSDNLSYFINYQLNHMYWRYFMWNFAGRQNDYQGNGEPHLGNWISGIPVIDNMRLGDQSMLPSEFGSANKGHNVFYMLPLLLGLFGLLMQALYKNWANRERGIEQFWIVFFLFFMTGIAIVLYLNQTPGQPRERDYAYAGSFYAFAMWIGLGIAALGVLLADLLEKNESKGMRIAVAAVAWIVGLAIPLQMVSQTWDDHDRSNRYTTRDFGFNYLSSVDPDGIIFTNGDNDTFPLWYAQEVEGFRRDVRVVNLSYLTTDWYATQQSQPTYDTDPIPMIADQNDWGYEKLAYSFMLPQNTEPTDVRDALNQLYSSEASRVGAHVLTNTNIYIPVDREAAMEHYSSGDAAIDSLYIGPYIEDVTTNLAGLGSGLNQSRVLSLDMIANSIIDNGQRPVYFASTVPSSFYLGLTPFMSATGLANEVTPVRQTGRYNVTAQKAYANIVRDYRWGGLDNPDVDLYLDETVRRMVSSVRMAVVTVAENLLDFPAMKANEAARKAAAAAGLPEPKTQADMARQLLDLVGEKLPERHVSFDGMNGLYMARAYYNLYLFSKNMADLDKAEAYALSQAARYAELVRYGASLDRSTLASLGSNELYSMSYLGEAVAIANRIAMLKAAPSLLDDEDYGLLWSRVNNLSATTDMMIVPMIYINGYTAEDLEAELPHYGESDQVIIGDAIATLRLHRRTGVDPLALSRRIMDEYGFNAGQWDSLHR